MNSAIRERFLRNECTIGHLPDWLSTLAGNERDLALLALDAMTKGQGIPAVDPWHGNRTSSIFYRPVDFPVSPTNDWDENRSRLVMISDQEIHPIRPQDALKNIQAAGIDLEELFRQVPQSLQEFFSENS